MDSANFLNLAGRLVRDAIARGVLNQDTGAAFITTAQQLTRGHITVSGADYPRQGASFADEPMTMTRTDEPPTIDMALGDVKSARANAFAKRMEGTN